MRHICSLLSRLPLANARGSGRRIQSRVRQRAVVAAILLLVALPLAAEPADWIWSGRYVITMDAPRRVIENGAVAVRGERIVGAGPKAELTLVSSQSSASTGLMPFSLLVSSTPTLTPPCRCSAGSPTT